MTAPQPERCASLRERKKRATREALHETALRLVTERGDPAAVTVEEICEEVGISARTFFNYFPTKLDAAFDLAPADIPPERARAFLDGNGDLVSDALALLAASADLPSDYTNIRLLLRQQPDLGMSFWKQTMGRLKPVHELLQQRAGDPSTARLAFGVIVIAALSSMIRPDNDGDPGGAAERLLTEVAQMKALLAQVDTSDAPGGSVAPAVTRP